MAFIVHKCSDRYLLQSYETGALAGLMIVPMPGETARAFSYDFGSTSDRRELLNIADFPELGHLSFFAIESAGFYELYRFLHRPDCRAVHPFLFAQAKVFAFNAARLQPPLHPVAPVWQYTPPNPAGSWQVPAFGLWVNAQGCWLSNRDGLVVAVDHHGQITHQHQLPKTVNCLLGDADNLIASCEDGQIYDLTGKLPQPLYNARKPNIPHHHNFLIHALALDNQRYLVLDAYGQLTCLDTNWQILWQQNTSTWQGWFLQADEQAIYLGHYRGVTCFDWKTGKIIWENATSAPVLCGQLTDQNIIVGTSDGTIYELQKVGDMKTRQTQIRTLATCEGAVYTCALSAQQNLLLAANYQSYLYSLTLEGEQHWLRPTGCGAVLNMRLWQNYLYVTTTDGTLACFDLKAITAAPKPDVSLTSETPKLPLASQPLQPVVSPAAAVAGRVLVECIKQGKQLKVRVISEGYHTDWNVQFPRHLRQEGVRYWVEDLKEAKQGGFYRVVGEIQRLHTEVS